MLRKHLKVSRQIGKSSCSTNLGQKKGPKIRTVSSGTKVTRNTAKLCWRISKSTWIKFKVLNIFFEVPFYLGLAYLKYLPRSGSAQQYLLQVQGFLSQENIISGAHPDCGVNFPMNRKLRTSETSSPSALRSRQIPIYFYILIKVSPPQKILPKQSTLLSTLHSLQRGPEDKHVTDGSYNA